MNAYWRMPAARMAAVTSSVRHAHEGRSVSQPRVHGDAGQERRRSWCDAEPGGEQGDSGKVTRRAAGPSPGQQREHARRDERRVQRVDLGDHRLRPEHPAEGEPQCAARLTACRHPSRRRDQEHQRDRQGARTDENRLIRYGSEPKEDRNRIREEHVERVARVVRHAEDAADELEHRRVEEGDEPWRERPHVHDQRAQPAAAARRVATIHVTGSDPRAGSRASTCLSAGVTIQPSWSTYPAVIRPRCVASRARRSPSTRQPPSLRPRPRPLPRTTLDATACVSMCSSQPFASVSARRSASATMVSVGLAKPPPRKDRRTSDEEIGVAVDAALASTTDVDAPCPSASSPGCGRRRHTSCRCGRC